MDRAALADFLRRRRELLRPADVGLPPGSRRRTPGLRREEVAALAGVSADYYTRLEQARGPHPSSSVVAAIARALRCGRDERDHLFHLAGLTPPPRRAGRHVPPGLLRLVDHLTEVPVLVLTDLTEVLWQNRLADLLTGPLSPDGGRADNAAWRWFTDPALRELAPPEDRARLSASHVRDLRAVWSRRAGDADVTTLVADLTAASVEFAELWERHEVAERRADHKRFHHPEVGLVEVTCEVLLTPESDLSLLVLFPTEGTDAREKLDLLRVIGTQDLDPSRP
ncbi:helix-turn-helix domain-containing protein [Actinomycetospora sp. TBRC 11914]|uniref:helix-turn-helix transcriptional regulator n=1 Tax=Actinomycetospora sp. TBRC 11914 TaxID=2729387 RepID=UPI00145F9A42|nr:helix-turn-helix domain-containing protein [Actinomycetospora sp. TBRC 11914]NMO93902.1 helix-turn-helix domain-containing protein [Actinomycetospora sp. TBRC 11914]